MTRIVAKRKVEAARPSGKKRVAKVRLREHEQAERPGAGDKRARERKIQPSSKDAFGRAWRHGLKVLAPYPGRFPRRESGRSQQRP